MLMKFLEFTFQDIWHFIGVLILLYIVCETISDIFRSLSHSHPINILGDNKSSDDKEGGINR